MLPQQKPAGFLLICFSFNSELFNCFALNYMRKFVGKLLHTNFAESLQKLWYSRKLSLHILNFINSRRCFINGYSHSGHLFQVLPSYASLAFVYECKTSCGWDYLSARSNFLRLDFSASSLLGLLPGPCAQGVFLTCEWKCGYVINLTSSKWPHGRSVKLSEQK